MTILKLTKYGLLRSKRPLPTMVQTGKPNMYNKVICTAFFFMIKMLYILNRYCSDKNIRCV